MEFPIGVNWVNGILWDEGLHILYAYITKKKQNQLINIVLTFRS